MSGGVEYFTDLSTPGPSGPIVGWAWDFGDGGTSGLENPSHNYLADGTYDVTLTVTGTSPDGTATVTHSVTVGPPAVLQAAFVYNADELDVTFTDQSTPGPSGPITAWAWDFGDSNTSTSENPTHTYASPGTYTVELTVTGTSPDGTSSDPQSVTVSSSPPPASQPLGVYDAPTSYSAARYNADWDAISAAISGASFMMAPLDSAVITHIGTNVQWCLIPAGTTAAQFITYGVPCWNTGMVEGFVVVDEPGSDPSSVALIRSIVAYVEANCTGTNNEGATVKTAVTQYDPGTLTALANDELVDILIIDRYPSRDDWVYTEWDACVAACEAALGGGKISAYWIVLDAFQYLPSYPAPTEAQLLDQIARSQATNAARLVAYSWGPDAGSPELANLPGLVAALDTIPG